MEDRSVIKRRKTKKLNLGGVAIGGDAPIAVQSMTNTDTRNVRATVAQIKALEKMGCEIVRVAVPDMDAAKAISAIKPKIKMPLIADIHFDHRLALAAMQNGAAGIRINPGNIARDKFREIVRCAQERKTVIRIGVNSGSLEKDLLRQYGGPTEQALVQSALRAIAFFEDQGFHRIKVSLKSSDVRTTIEAYRILSGKTDYPLHLGVTEAGTLVDAAVKSSLGMGILLYEGIGDTLRVSVTGNPCQEIPIAYAILRSLQIRKVGPEIISCPTCGRCEIDLPALVRRIQKALAERKEYLKIALMGCVVNGPGEAADADIGLAGGKGRGVIFRNGKIYKTVCEDDFLDVLVNEIDKITEERNQR